MKQQKQYDEQLKQQAIEMALEGTKPIAQIARDLEIKNNTLYGWVNKYRQANNNKAGQLKTPTPINLEAENKKLKRELSRAKEDIELLKKAAAYFAAHK